jgi:hypothetical protein
MIAEFMIAEINSYSPRMTPDLRRYEQKNEFINGPVHIGDKHTIFVFLPARTPALPGRRRV